MVYFIIEVLNDTQAVIKSRDKKTNVYYLSEFFNYTKTTFKTSYDTAYNTLVEKLIDMGVDVYGTGGGSSNLVIYDENGNALPVKEKLQFTGSTSVTETTDRIIVNVTGGGGSGGLQKVIHDNTLSGDGTNANPLSVIGGGGSSGSITYKTFDISSPYTLDFTGITTDEVVFSILNVATAPVNINFPMGVYAEIETFNLDIGNAITIRCIKRLDGIWNIEIGGSKVAI